VAGGAAVELSGGAGADGLTASVRFAEDRSPAEEDEDPVEHDPDDAFVSVGVARKDRD